MLKDCPETLQKPLEEIEYYVRFCGNDTFVMCEVSGGEDGAVVQISCAMSHPLAQQAAIKVILYVMIHCCIYSASLPRGASSFLRFLGLEESNRALMKR